MIFLRNKLPAIAFLAFVLKDLLNVYGHTMVRVQPFHRGRISTLFFTTVELDFSLRLHSHEFLLFVLVMFGTHIINDASILGRSFLLCSLRSFFLLEVQIRVLISIAHICRYAFVLGLRSNLVVAAVERLLCFAARAFE